jgi:NitT/TauT family transport system ATP-binding protein
MPPSTLGDALAVDVRKASLIYNPDSAPVHALADIDLAIEPGEFVSLIGPSGCGKTTLLRVIADLEPISSGEVLVNGLTPQQARLARAYGYVFQAPALFPWRTVLANVMLPLLGVSNPAMIDSKVLLPDPRGPNKKNVFPGA